MKDKHDIEPRCIPSIEAIQEQYENQLRKEASQLLEDEHNKFTDGQESFFKAFRRFEQISESSVADENTDIEYFEKYRAYVEKETANQGLTIEEIETLIEYQTFFLKWERRVSYESNNYSHHRSNSATRYRVDRIERLKKEIEKLLDSSAEAWEFYHTRQLLSDIETQHQQRLVTVPYVMEAKEKVIDSLNLGMPVYIVGHLGSGKTQLATEAAMDFSIQNKIQAELEDQLEKWYCANPKAGEKEAIEKFKEIYTQRKQYYKEILTNGTQEEIESLQPLFISGSHNLTYEDMFVEKTLTLKHSFSQKSYNDYLDMIIGDFYQWLHENEDKLQQMTEEEKLQLKIQIWNSFSDLLVASNSAFGTEIKKIEKEILIAVKEGRPVIIDEINTIAMQNLIGLNDILQHHAGHTAYITGVGPVLIKPGFAFIGTGNLSTQMVNYEGTNELNPAFKSRFVTIEYNYVSQNTKGSMEEQADPEKNELFRVIIARLSNANGTIQIPNPKRTLEELFRFSQLCRVTQNVFMGKWKDEEQKDFSGGELELRESVLSIRNILHVLDNWNQGEEKDLSKALWDGFISSITYSDDQNYILSQAVRFGFFPAEEGWKIETKGIGESTTTYDEIRTRPYRYVRPKTQTLSHLDVVHMLFGKGTQRKNIPEELKNIFQSDLEDTLRIDAKKYQLLDQKLSHLEHSKALLEHLENKGG
jgi:MoxR-like ATPase